VRILSAAGWQQHPLGEEGIDPGGLKYKTLKGQAMRLPFLLVYKKKREAVFRLAFFLIKFRRYQSWTCVE
jgi:hypothetical protein